VTVTARRGPGGQTGPSGLLSQMPFAVKLGIALDIASPQQVTGRMSWAPDLCTAGGVMHGGALMALADSLGGICAFLNLPPGGRTATMSSASNLLRAVLGGDVMGVARPLSVGRTVIVVQTELRDSENNLIAQTTQTQAVLPGR
jgi:1,4-dihydroxy-2-naphthoyl-CoA hydrolase